MSFFDFLKPKLPASILLILCDKNRTLADTQAAWQVFEQYYEKNTLDFAVKQCAAYPRLGGVGAEVCAAALADLRTNLENNTITLSEKQHLKDLVFLYVNRVLWNDVQTEAQFEVLYNAYWKSGVAHAERSIKERKLQGIDADGVYNSAMAKLYDKLKTGEMVLNRTHDPIHLIKKIIDFDLSNEGRSSMQKAAQAEKNEEDIKKLLFLYNMDIMEEVSEVDFQDLLLQIQLQVSPFCYDGMLKMIEGYSAEQICNEGLIAHGFTVGTCKARLSACKGEILRLLN
jgi:hypothetical protein